MDWIITLPQTIAWNQYEKELKVVEDYSSVMNYRVPYKPKAKPNDRCFIVWKGEVRGWMEITGVKHYPEGFTCTTTGQYWRKGYYIQRSGPFYKVNKKIKMKGFRGVHKFLLTIGRQ